VLNGLDRQCGGMGGGRELCQNDIRVRASDGCREAQKDKRNEERLTNGLNNNSHRQTKQTRPGQEKKIESIKNDKRSEAALTKNWKFGVQQKRV